MPPVPKSQELGRTVVFFPGSSIGNLTRGEAVEMLERMRRICGPEGRVVIGFDRHKPSGVLEAAYDDAAGVTANFNLNVLERIDGEFGGRVDVSGFTHRAVYDEVELRVEMRLVSRQAQTVEVGGERFGFESDEFVLTEYSHKYTAELVDALGEAALLRRVKTWSDAEERFSVVMYEPR